MKFIIRGAKLLPWLLGLVCAASQAEIYQWVDAQGRTHFDDNRPDAGREKVEEVKVRKPNLMNRFVAPPPAAKPAPKQEVNKTPPVSASPPKEPVGVAASQATCAEKKQAYEASQACYAACGKPVWGGRNNAECGQCTDLPDPHC